MFLSGVQLQKLAGGRGKKFYAEKVLFLLVHERGLIATLLLYYCGMSLVDYHAESLWTSFWIVIEKLLLYCVDAWHSPTTENIIFSR